MISVSPNCPGAAITAIEYHLPEAVLSNDQLAAAYPDWSVHKIEGKTGIRERHITAPGECASDLAVRAGQKLFDSGAVEPRDIDMLLFCTQTPDHFLPATACIVQDRLGMPTTTGALDFNLGCSGFVYGLGLAKGLIESGQAETILLITADTYSKLIADDDRSARTVFGDAAAATLIQRVSFNSHGCIEAPVWGTDGRGAPNLIVKGGAARSWTQRAGSSEYSPCAGAHRRLAGAQGLDVVMDTYRLDALVAPTTSPAWKIDLVNGDLFRGSSAMSAALAGYPLVSVPAGDVMGLPVGITFMGRAWSEPTLIKFAYAFEQATKARRPPQYRATTL